MTRFLLALKTLLLKELHRYESPEVDESVKWYVQNPPSNEMKVEYGEEVKDLLVEEINVNFFSQN